MVADCAMNTRRNGNGNSTPNDRRQLNADTVLHGRRSGMITSRSICIVSIHTRSMAPVRSWQRMLTMSSREKKVVPTMKIICSPCVMPVTAGRRHVKTAGGAGDTAGSGPMTTVRGMGGRFPSTVSQCTGAWCNAFTREIRAGGVKTAIYNRRGYKPRNSGRGGVFRVIMQGGV
jgi:hypothetical protein